MKNYDVVIVGAGFTGLTAAFVLAKSGKKVVVVEADSAPGGLAGTFEFSDGVRLEKFYHHWFNNDSYVPELIKELGLVDRMIVRPTETGMYFNGRTWRLSKPMDLLRFKALSIVDRIRLGLLVLKVRRVRHWRSIEHLNIREWLEPLCGKNVFSVVWEPLIVSKFSNFAEEVNAVWMWKKLVLRGGTRNRKGGEELAYFKGGFGSLADAMVTAIRKLGGDVVLDRTVTGVVVEEDRVITVNSDKGDQMSGQKFIFTPAFPIIANLFEPHSSPNWIEQLRRVNYLANVCLVLRLNKSLSKTYWLNVNDPGFPFVGVIEHTNFDSPEFYGGTHIVYLSRYLSEDDPIWSYKDEKYFEFALNHLKRMFPQIDSSWIVDYRVWRASYAQPVTEREYSQLVPNSSTPFKNAWISTMAQIYPEDRGTNYAIREGRNIAELVTNQ
jgi:protoporphyrinogen oxidase